MKFTALLITALLYTLSPSVQAEGFIDDLTHTWQSRTQSAPATRQIEVGFSPEGSALTLVLKAIGTAHTSIRVLAYSFPANPSRKPCSPPRNAA